MELLGNVFAELFGDERDAVEHIVAMTYEFDDQQLLNLLLQRPLAERFEPRITDLASVAEMAPVVIYDARKTREGGLVPHFLELLPVRMQPWSCHHPKAYLAVTPRRVHLLIGSMNLTASGLFANREVFCRFSWSEQEREDLGVLAAFTALLRDGHASFRSASLARTVHTLQARLRAWGPGAPPSSRHLVSSGYGASGIDALAALYGQLMPDGPPEAIFAVSPFFDNGRELLAELLDRRFGTPKRLELVTDESTATVLCRRHLGKAAMRRLFLLAERIGEAEQRRIAGANEGASLEGLVLRRRLHAKVLVLARGRQSLVYVGSANFTCKAWNGDNRELGVAWLHEGDPQALWSTIRRQLSAPGTDCFAGLPEEPPPGEAPACEDDYVQAVRYPDFIEGIELACLPGEQERLAFTVRAPADRLPELAQYHIHWGAVRLDFVQGRSQPLPVSTLQAHLLGGRHLRFTDRGDDQVVHHLPFRHDAELFAMRELYVHPTAEDWMAHCLGRERRGAGGAPGGGSPGEPPPSGDVVLLEREANPVIRMQHYLSSFSHVEREFRERAAKVAKLAEPEQGQRWEDLVARPLATLATLLQREQASCGVEATAFKLGELVLLAAALAGPPRRRRALAQALAARLPQEAAGPVAEYLRYCRTQASQ